MKLDNFFVSGANEEAVAMAEAVLNNVKAYSPVLRKTGAWKDSFIA